MDWKAATNILAVRLDGMGDLLMTVPALRALKTSGGKRRVTLLAGSGGAPVAPLLPEIDSVIAYDAPWIKASSPAVDANRDRAMIERLHSERFDGAVIFNVFSQNPLPAALLCYLAEIPLRAAYCRENPYHLLTDWIPDPDSTNEMRHEVARQIDLAAAIGFRCDDDRMNLVVPPGAARAVRERLRKARVNRNRWLVIHPGATAASRRYPARHFAAAIRSLRDAHGFDLVLSGDCTEPELVDFICAESGGPAVSFCGQLSLSEFAALIALAPVIVSNNTSAAHIAAAVGTPVVDLYALTNPQHTPWRVRQRVLNHDVPCKNCFKSVCPEQHHACLDLVAPDHVVEAVLDLLSESGHRFSTHVKQNNRQESGGYVHSGY